MKPATDKANRGGHLTTEGKNSMLNMNPAEQVVKRKSMAPVLLGLVVWRELSRIAEMPDSECPPRWRDRLREKVAEIDQIDAAYTQWQIEPALAALRGYRAFLGELEGEQVAA